MVRNNLLPLGTFLLLRQLSFCKNGLFKQKTGCMSGKESAKSDKLLFTRS
jgi:hypothetical protein